MVTKKRMAGMKLSDFGGQSATVSPEPEPKIEAAPEPKIEPKPVAVAPPPLPVEPPEPVAKTPKRKPEPKKEERLVTVNIKIKEAQQEWLTDTAKQVRQNNDAPVPASDRVYPQHLIQTAIDLLQSANVNWQQVKNVEDLRKVLSL